MRQLSVLRMTRGSAGITLRHWEISVGIMERRKPDQRKLHIPSQLLCKRAAQQVIDLCMSHKWEPLAVLTVLAAQSQDTPFSAQCEVDSRDSLIDFLIIAQLSSERPMGVLDSSSVRLT